MSGLSQAIVGVGGGVCVWVGCWVAKEPHERERERGQREGERGTCARTHTHTSRGSWLGVSKKNLPAQPPPEAFTSDPLDNLCVDTLADMKGAAHCTGRCAMARLARCQQGLGSLVLYVHSALSSLCCAGRKVMGSEKPEEVVVWS